MAPNTDFSIPVNSDIDLSVKHSKKLESRLEAPSTSVLTHCQRPGTMGLGPFRWNLFLEKHTQKLFIASNWSLFYPAVSSSEYNPQLS